MIQHGLRDDRNETLILLPSKMGIQVLCHRQVSENVACYFPQADQCQTHTFTMGRLSLASPPIAAVQTYFVKKWALFWESRQDQSPPSISSLGHRFKEYFQALQEAHRSNLDVIACARLCGQQVVHIHYGEQVWVLGLEDEVGLMPTAVFDLKIDNQMSEDNIQRYSSLTGYVALRYLSGVLFVLHKALTVYTHPSQHQHQNHLVHLAFNVVDDGCNFNSNLPLPPVYTGRRKHQKSQNLFKQNQKHQHCQQLLEK